MAEDDVNPRLGRFDPLASDLHVAGAGYLRLGLDHMHKHAWAQGSWIQPALANMAIGVELMCKSFLASENPLFIFDRVRPEIAWAVHRPGFGLRDVPYERIHTLMDAGGHRTIGLAECIDYLQARYPECVAELGEWGRRLAGWRAVCVHFVLPDVETRAVQRVAYAALSVAAFLSERQDSDLLRFTPAEADRQFLAKFGKEKAQDLDNRIKAAKKRVKDMSGRVMIIGLSADDCRELTCEVCGNDGVAFGERSIEEGCQMLFLNEFSCDECGLQLYDAEEMQQCGFETVHEIGPYEQDSDND